MTRAAALHALLLATSTIVPVAAFAQPAPSPSAQPGTADAIRVLLDQATYWLGQSQEDKASVAISRVLVLDPNNADALAMQAQAAADAGDEAVAAAALAKLRAARPDDPRIATIQQAVKAGPIDAALIAQARALAKADKPDEAIAVYRQAFKGNAPSPALALEYYQTMIGSKQDWSVPRAGLANMIRANPENLKAQLAYAELLTYHGDTRDEGIERLARLAQNPTIGAQATKDLRQSLLWLDIGPDSLPQYDIYLAKHPDDKEIATLAEAARTNTGEFKTAGYYYLARDKLAEADEQFSDALRRVPNDPNAMIGLALTRWREKRIAEAQDLFKQAVAIDPGKQADYQKFIEQSTAAGSQNGTGFGGGTYRFRQAGNVDYGRAARRRIQAQYAHVTALAKAGEFDQASALLRKLGGRHPNAATLTYLADLQARGGHLAEAESQYRAVLARSPRNVLALGGLAGVLAREGKQAESDALYAQAAQLPGGAAVGVGRAESLRLEAEQMSDPAAKAAVLRTAVNADPGNPWTRLDLARALRAGDDDAGARAVMEPLLTAAHPTPTMLQAAIYYAIEVKDNADVVRLVDRLPPKDQTAPMLNYRAIAQVSKDLDDAKALGSEPAERDRLLSLAVQPDPTGLRVSRFATELTAAGDKPAAREAIRLALAARPATAEQRIAYAGALLGAGYALDAARVSQSVAPTTGLMTQRLAAVRDSIAVVRSDRLNAAGRPDEAYNELEPRLAATPDSADLNLALARLYATNQQPAKAEQITEGLLSQNPSNLAVRSSAVYAKLAGGETGAAETLARETTEQFPDEPQAWIDLANVERARGRAGNALRDLQTAKSLREKQLAGQQSAAEQNPGAPKTAAVEPLRRRYARYALYIPPNLANDASPEMLPEPVSRQYAQYDPNHAQLPIEGPPASNSPLVSTSFAPFAAVSPARATAAPAGSAFMPAASAAGPAPAPVQTAQLTPFLTAPESGNPFHPGSSPLPTIDEQGPPNSSTSLAPAPEASGDAMTAQILQSIRQVSQEVAPRLDASVEVFGRTGTQGISELIELAAPLEASYSPSGYGRLKVVVTPTYLFSGKPANGFEFGQYGTNPLASGSAVTPRNQTAFGTALDVGYAYDIATADIGSSPLGFRETNVVGGIELAPKLTQNITLHVLAERRAVTDSLLSFGGLRDGRTGETWGGVTRNRGHIQVEGPIGLANYFVGAGGGYMDGHNVASNTEIDAIAGVTYPVWQTPTQVVRVGTQVVYFGYGKNLDGFSLGQGGYFSPQDYAALLFPVSYRDQVTPDLMFGVGGSVGYQTYRSASSNVFPNNAALQSQLASLAATTGGNTTVSGSHGSGLAGGVNGEIDYRVRENLHIGARAGFDHSGSFSEGTGLIYARYVFDNNP